ncbi:ArnT family glycosyltransferase [Nocardia asteroides]|uniref:ArnT family glycosyltransferase n=1 Tax=Nocardia asteroides TaxID=1824 RepID=UPI0034464FCF
MTHRAPAPEVRPAPPAELAPFAWREVTVVVAIAATLFLLRLDRYRIGGDELYFVAAGHRPSVSYADQGAVVPLLAALADHLAPGSTTALRLPAVVCTLAAVALSAVLAREFGGGRLPQTVAALAYATTPLAVMQSAMLSTFALDVTLTAVVAWLLIRWVRTRADGLLVAAGLVAALDFHVKWLIPIVWAGLTAGVLLFGPRAMLRRPAWWLGSALLVGAAVPVLWWQHEHGWPQVSMGAVVRAEQLATASPIMLPWTMIQLTGALGVLLLAGMWGGLRSPHLRPYYFLIPMIALGLGGVAFGGLRPYFVAGAFPGLFAAGAVYLAEIGLARRARIAGALLTGIATATCLVLVLALPLPQSWLTRPTDDYADNDARSKYFGQGGWSELVSTVDGAYRALPAEGRDGLVLVTQNYWQAAALEYYGPARGLPAVYSPNRGYGYFAAPPDDTDAVLYVGVDHPEVVLGAACADTTMLARIDEPLGYPGVNRAVAVWLCRTPHVAWAALWPTLRTLGFVDGTARPAR